MSIGDKGTCVRILEKEFRVACPPNQEHALRAAAQYLDQQMRQIRQTGRVFGIERIAVMAALNIAHELLNLRGKIPEQEEETFVQRLKILQDKIDGVLSQGGSQQAAVAKPAVTANNLSAARAEKVSEQELKETLEIF